MQELHVISQAKKVLGNSVLEFPYEEWWEAQLIGRVVYELASGREGLLWQVDETDFFLGSSGLYGWLFSLAIACPRTTNTRRMLEGMMRGRNFVERFGVDSLAYVLGKLIQGIDFSIETEEVVRRVKYVARLRAKMLAGLQMCDSATKDWEVFKRETVTSRGFVHYRLDDVR